jgi:hypothetical protein
MKSQKTNINKERQNKPTPQQMPTTNRNIINHRHPGEGRDPGATISVKLTSVGATEQRENQQKIYYYSLLQLLSHLKGCHFSNTESSVPSDEQLSFNFKSSDRMPKSRLFKKTDSINNQGDENNLNQKLNGEIG